MGKTKKEQKPQETESVFNVEMTDVEKQELTDLEKEALELAKEVEVEEIREKEEVVNESVDDKALVQNDYEDNLIENEETSEQVDENFVENAIGTIDEEKIPVEIERDNDDFEREKELALLDKEDEIKKDLQATKEEKKELPKKSKKKINLPQPVKYAFFTLSAGLIQFIVSTILFTCLPDMGKINVIITMEKSQFIANTVGLVLSILWNFTFNRKFTFKSAGNVPRAMVLAFLFYVPFYPFQIWCEPTLAHAIAPGQDWANIIALVVVMLTNGVLEFCWQKFVIYRKEENTAVQKEK
ncbi:MAG: GtrA family protein [Clostridia bacterium]|nr:GtrA family protein [Clostridia bacterium]MDY5264105.1 GtrA family protein [Eubacteriales bacterium]